MTFRFNYQHNALLIALLVLPSVRCLAQGTLLETGNALPQQPQAQEELEATQDPTAPSDRLLNRIPRPVQPQPAQTSLPTTLPKPKAPAPAAVSLPALPSITLRGLVMRTPDRGTAMLDVDGNSVTISLLPRDLQQRIPIPEVQFAAMKTALDQRSAFLKASNKTEADVKTRSKSYEMSLQCSFIAGETVFNLEAFTSDALLLRAVPHDSMFIVRKASQAK